MLHSENYLKLTIMSKQGSTSSTVSDYVSNWIEQHRHQFLNNCDKTASDQAVITLVSLIYFLILNQFIKLLE